MPKGSHRSSDSSVPSDVTILSDSDNMAKTNTNDRAYAHLSDSEYARKRRELLELARSLNDLEYAS